MRMAGAVRPASSIDGKPPAANFVGGVFIASASDRTYARCNPWRPDEVVAEPPDSIAADIDAAVAAAVEAAPAWAATPLAARAAVLSRAADLIESEVEAIARQMTAEIGKPMKESRGEAGRAAALLRFFAAEAWRPIGDLFEQSSGGGLYTRRRPVGVVGLITPWNFPIAIPVWKSAPALVHGNAVVMKLAQESPLTGLWLASCFQRAGIPDGVLSVVCGDGPEVGGRLVAHPDVAAISFTGSVATGELVRDTATALGKRVQLELGGQNPVIVMADADLPAAAAATVAGAFWSAGQKCTATRRIYVQAEAYEGFRGELLERVAALRVGDPADAATEVGPLVSEKQVRSVLDGIEQGRTEGATTIAGGARAEDPGLLVEPTLFEDVADDGFLSREEVFGPVASLYSFADLDEAIARANAVPHGLSAAIFTRDIGAARQFVARLEAGLLHVNSQTAGADVHVPFGGIKASGHGPHEQGRAARDFYTDLVTVYEDS